MAIICPRASLPPPRSEFSIFPPSPSNPAPFLSSSSGDGSRLMNKDAGFRGRGRRERARSKWERTRRGERTKRKIKGERDFVAWTTEAKAGIIDESFRNLDFEAGSPLNGMNTGRTIVRRTFGGFGWEVLSSRPREQVFGIDYPPVSHRKEPDDDSRRRGQIFSFVLNEYHRGNGERTEMSKYPTKNPSRTRLLTEVGGFVTISSTLLPISSKIRRNFRANFTTHTNKIWCNIFLLYVYLLLSNLINLKFLFLLHLIKLVNLKNFTICIK